MGEGRSLRALIRQLLKRSFSDMIRLRNIPIQQLTEGRLGIEKTVLDFELDRITKEGFNLFKMNMEESEK